MTNQQSTPQERSRILPWFITGRSYEQRAHPGKRLYSALGWYRHFREIVLMFAISNIEPLCEPL